MYPLTLKGAQTNERSDDTSHLEAVVAQQAQQLSPLIAKMAAIENSHGSTFVRWGRSDCPASTDTVYSGVAGGSWYAESGGPANRLCLSLHPQFDNEAPLGGYHNNLRGAEYYIPGHAHTDVVCAVCLTPHPVTIMVPGTSTCPPGWIPQYTGHLTAGDYTSPEASEYLCLDGQPEDRAGSEAAQAAAFFMYTVAVCANSLPCPPYVDGKVVTCAVCSK